MKKKIALTLLKEIQPKIDKHKSLIDPVLNTDALFHLIDKDQKSDFYFKIYPSKKDSAKYISDLKPSHSQTTQNYKSVQSIENISKQFDTWINILKEYDSISSIYDDPIVEAYQKEFEGQFDLVDEDADVVSYDLERQLYIDQYLDRIILKLTEARTDNNKEEIDDIINEAEELKVKQSSLNKRQVVNKLSLIWAKTRKHGFELLKQIYLQGRNEIIKQLVKGFLK